jgi:hypothetical protein
VRWFEEPLRRRSLVSCCSAEDRHVVPTNAKEDSKKVGKADNEALVAAGYGNERCTDARQRRLQEDAARDRLSLRRSAERSRRRKSTPYRSAMSMLTFYINRGGKNLTAAQKQKLERAKDELRELYGKAG